MLVLDFSTLLDMLASFMFLMVRTSALFLVAPVFVIPSISIYIRVVFSAVVVIMIMGSADVKQIAITPTMSDVSGVLQEIVLAAAMGFVIKMIFASVSIAGEYISSMMGLSFASIVDPATSDSTPLLSQFMTVMLTLVFLSLNGHIILITMLKDSYILLPAGSISISYQSLLQVIMVGGYMFVASVIILVPVGLVLFMANITIGVLTRLSPQMNIFSIGFPFSIILGIVVMAVSLPGVEAYMQEIVLTSFERVRDIMLSSDWK